jgi:hypothetical protein
LPKRGGWRLFSHLSRAEMRDRERWRWQLASEDCLLFLRPNDEGRMGFLLPFVAELSSEHLFVPSSSAIVTFPAESRPKPPQRSLMGEG